MESRDDPLRNGGEGTEAPNAREVVSTSLAARLKANFDHLLASNGAISVARNRKEICAYGSLVWSSLCS